MGHRTTAQLEAALDDIRRAPADDGRVDLVVSRPANGEREVLSVGVLDAEVGLVGDNWLAFGRDAMRFVNSPQGRALRLRGLNARVLVAGKVRPGDAVRKLQPATGGRQGPPASYSRSSR